VNVYATHPPHPKEISCAPASESESGALDGVLYDALFDALGCRLVLGELSSDPGERSSETEWLLTLY
jgi:hypothetical protein